jgi:hypothetical protein
MKICTGQDDIFGHCGKIGSLIPQGIIWEFSELGKYELLHNGPVLSRRQMEFSGQIFILDHEMFLKIVGVDVDKKVWD